MPAPFHQHLQTVRDDHTNNVAFAQAILPQLLHKLSLLPIEYKQELAASDDWQESKCLVLEADRMVNTLNFPTSVENRLSESRPAYEEGLQQVASWKVRRKGALDGYWQETLEVMAKFKEDPTPAVDKRIAIVTQGRDNFSEGLEVREAELSVLRQSVHGRLRPVLEGNQEPGKLSRNECPIFLVEYENPASLGCDHIFSFNDLVSWVDEHSDCPMCREPAELDKVQRLDVERVDGQPACEAVEVEQTDEESSEG
ncbi:hypothetical protein M409DRAFT_22201 [Zasmidium cellare ATCC 36951]|uniref:RING-type domain-containing protein n=1 Tax=Zasmidium cellare ATCC 36951 TaxID=1080233 RepID=A0A6A6CMK6_ZASCE|nr:uncharacterized protein M409DRAFT_22201 [Zasmidium cellare ATCC 36951]KAF2167390.1 hypothetical protein M409DRAFT_22201 [Zasmidium cellare ATCC 36951]